MAGAKINTRNVKYAINMVSDLRYNGPINILIEHLAKYQPKLSTYYYHFGYSGLHSLCDKGTEAIYNLQIP